jgi:hypothetical protein
MSYHIRPLDREASTVMVCAALRLRNDLLYEFRLNPDSVSGYFLLSISVLSQDVLPLFHLKVRRSAPPLLPGLTHGLKFGNIEVISASSVLSYVEVVV